MAEKVFGHFDDAQREYVITEPATPVPWINYLGSDGFFTLISNTGGGYSFYRDAKLLRITRYRYNDVPQDTNGHYVYIKDGSTVWNPGWQPTKTPLDSYSCRHGLGYTVLTGAKNGVSAEMLCFVPRRDPAEIMRVRIKNESGVPKDLKLFSYVEWCLWNADDDERNLQRNLSTGEVEIHGALIIHKTEYRERRNHYAYFWTNREIAGFDTDRQSFIGAYSSAERPEAVLKGACTNSVASGWSPIAAHEIDLHLEPGESTSAIFVLGYAENEEDEKWAAPGVVNRTKAEELVSRYAADEAVDAALAELQAYWQKLLSTFQVRSADPRLDRMANIWNQYQCMVTFNMSRSASYYESGIGRGMGFRDSNQDLLGFVHLIPEAARQRIIDIASTQKADGSAYHQYQPLTKRGNSDIGSGFNDDPLWLVAGVSAYVRETGDTSILDVPVPFDNDESTDVPLMEHLKRSVDYTLTHLGPHGLPLIGRADWNDCLNLNCFSAHPGEPFQTTGPSEGPVAESVFIAAMFVKYGHAYADLARFTGDAAEADRLDAAADEMEKRIERDGWDGEWFLRAYDAAGNKVGSHECEEGQIYIETQGFCPLAGVGLEDGLAEQALASAKERLDTEFGVMILQPAYTRYHLELGEISSYPPGYKENAGIFCHNNPWISISECMVGHGDRAFKVYRKICPAYLQDKMETHTTEPYVYSQMVAGRDAVHFGQAKNSWLTGTAAWTFVNLSQYILGIRPELEGLAVDPCLPKASDGFTVTRVFRGDTYHIHVTNPKHVEKGIAKLVVDGTELSGNLIPAPKKATGAVHEVEAVMG
jgi:cellobiose phosphorylase